MSFLLEHGAGALVLDPGLGKTSIVLEAFRILKASGQAEKMLVVAPLRVCQLVWAQEGAKWTQFRDLTFSLLHGPKKEKRLRDDADVHLINPEGVAWLSEHVRSDRFPWDTVVVDELTRFKNHRARRSKLLRKKIANVRRCWGLTGSLIPNGYMDLFGQMLLLDGGVALGQHITYFRDQYFTQGFNGFDWNLRPGAAERIEAKVAPYLLRMSAEDYLELPPLTDNVIPAPMPPAALAKYEEMKSEMLVELPEGTVTAANAGGVYAKLKQITNGAVYIRPNEKEYAEIHKAKVEAVQDLVEELAGQPLLIAYEFNHDLERLRAALGEDTPALAGLSGRRVEEVEAAWNRGELPVLLVHPASAGHGLNLQAAAGSGTAHLCWFSLPWDLELYDQTIRRLHRQGTEADRVINHIIISGEMDDVVREALAGKDTTMGRLLSALNAEVLRDDPAPTAAGDAARTEDDSNMVKKLGFQGSTPAPAQTQAAVQPKGWGAPAAAPAGVTEEGDEELPPTGQTARGAQPAAPVTPKGWGPPAGAQPSGQQEQIRGKIRAPVLPEEDDGEEEEFPVSARALEAFPPGVVDQLTGEGEGGEDEEGIDQAPPAEVVAPAAAEAPERPRRGRRARQAREEAPASAPEPPAAPDASEGQEDASPTIQAAIDSANVYRGAVEGDFAPQGRLTIDYFGIPSAALAAIFASLAQQFGAE